MKRLVDEQDASATLRNGANLAAAVVIQSAPLGLQQRVRARLLHGERRNPLWRLRPLVVGLLLACSLAAAAAVAHWARAPKTAPGVVPRSKPAPVPESRLVATPVVPSVATPPRALRVETRTKLAAPPVASAAQLPTTKTTAPVDEADEDEGAPAPRPTAEAKTPDRPKDPEATLVLAAARLLQQQHDPARALPLLEEYLRRYPDGDLVEESFALTIEAKVLLGDPSGTNVARDYLARFPGGRFREEARRAVLKLGR